MNHASRLKGTGYLVSAISVVLLATVSFKAAEKEPVLLACLMLGAAASIIGMALRWHSHRLEVAEKSETEQRSHQS